MPTLIALLLFATTFHLISPMRVTVWDNAKCKALGPSWTGFLGPTSGCQFRGMDRGDRPDDIRDEQEAGVIAKMVEDSEEDASQFIVFFEGEDCDPDKIIARSDEGVCSSNLPNIDKYGSWEIWDMCNGTPGCDLDAGDPEFEEEGEEEKE